MNKLKKIKLVSRSTVDSDILGFSNQTVHNSGKLGICEFIFDSKEKDYDWFVVIDEIPKVLKTKYEVLNCSSKNTILVTTEPSSITRYGASFASQFEYLITNQSEKVLPHRNCIRTQTGNVWMYGKSYDEIINTKEIVKTKKISTICSNKSMGHTLHKLRFDFTKKLQEEIEITRCGWGYKTIDKKFEAMDDFEFHLCIENHIAKDVWTEKIADAFLAYCVPIYYGCPNIYDYFPEDSIILIDLNDFEASIEKIKKIISTPGEYEKRLNAVKEARKLVIKKYNLLEMINQIVEKNHSEVKDDKEIRVYNRRTMRTRNLKDLFNFLSWKVSSFFKSNIAYK